MLPHEAQEDDERGRKKSTRKTSSKSQTTFQPTPPPMTQPYDDIQQSHRRRGRFHDRRLLLPDEWESSYTATKRIPVHEENESYIKRILRMVDPQSTTLEGSSHPEANAIQLFMEPDPQKSPRKWRSRNIEEFCLGAQTGLDNFVPPSATLDQDSEFQDFQTPKIWVDDRNWDTGETRKYKKVLSNAELEDLLREKVDILTV